MNLTLFKGKQIAAKKGYDLLKSKADALKVTRRGSGCLWCSASSHSEIPFLIQVRFRDICKVIYDTKVGMSEQSSAAFFSLTQAEYAAGRHLEYLIFSFPCDTCLPRLKYVPQ